MRRRKVVLEAMIEAMVEAMAEAARASGADEVGPKDEVTIDEVTMGKVVQEAMTKATRAARVLGVEMHKKEEVMLKVGMQKAIRGDRAEAEEIWRKFEKAL